MRHLAAALTLALALALAVLPWPGAAPRAADPSRPAAREAQHGRDESRADVRRWEALLERLGKLRDARDARALAQIDREVAAELLQERKESEAELRRLLDEVQRDARPEPGAVRRRAAEEHHERADRARLEAIMAEWTSLRGRYEPADVARRRTSLAELVAQARRELSGDTAEPEEGPAAEPPVAR